MERRRPAGWDRRRSMRFAFEAHRPLAYSADGREWSKSIPATQ
jgi:hypothetical protein